MYSVFDIAGPIMIGPSSSHTAGACKIGQIARALFHGTPEKVEFHLHGSFAEVYKGHATDRALLAGIMKFKTSDPRMKNAFELAKRKGIAYEFKKVDLGTDAHPNTVRIVLHKQGRKKMTVIGSSIGGGMVIINKINGFDVNFREMPGRYKTLIMQHESPKVAQKIIDMIEAKGISVTHKRSTIFEDSILSILDTNGRHLTLDEVREMEKTPGVLFIRSLSKLPN